jgi:acetate kinase
MKVLTLNAGSNSLKFEVVEAQRGDSGQFGKSIVGGVYDDIGKEGSSFSIQQNKRDLNRKKVEIRDHGQATESLIDWIERGEGEEHGIRSLSEIERVAHRIVHGADLFEAPVTITDDVVRMIEGLEDLAPLHNVSALKVVRAAQTRLRQRLPMIAVFDTVFHRNIPDRAGLYAIPVDVAQRNRIRRYGFHGLSHRYMAIRYSQITQQPLDHLKLITLHLEGGSSAAAIENGKSIDTSMGLTPLEGLIMGTRCGDLDPAVVTYLMRKEDMDAKAVEKFLNKECGLLGVSGVSADTRQLLKRASEDRVRLAIDLFCYRVRKYIGAYLAALEGADAIVAGGGISENTAVVREEVFQHFKWCGAVLDREQNPAVIDREGRITTADSRLPIWIIPTQEGLMMAHDAANHESS